MTNDNNETQASPSPRRRRRRPKNNKEAQAPESNLNETSEDQGPSPQPQPQPAEPKAETPQRRPRRRSRANKTPAQKESADAATAQDAAASTDSPITVQMDTTGLEALMAKQNSLISSHLSRQGGVLREIRNSLANIAREGQLSNGTETTKFFRLPRVGIFVDVPNIQYATERFDSQLDYGKLLAMLSKDRELIRASAYAPVAEESRDPSRLLTQRFVQPFVGKGYKIVTKPLKRFGDGSVKANFDVELAIDILTMSDRLDLVCLVSGDGDFSRLVELVQSRGVRVEVIAFAASTSNELRALADDYVELDSVLEELKEQD